MGRMTPRLQLHLENSPKPSDGKLLVREEVQDGDRPAAGWRGAGPMAAEEVRLQHSDRAENR